MGFLSRKDGQLSFSAQDWRLPVLGASAFPLSDAEVLATFDAKPGARGRIELGRDSRTGLLPFAVPVDDLLARHMAVLGSTGQGKTHFVAALLQTLLKAPHARAVVFDVNGEYERALRPLGIRLKVTRLGSGGERLPYYALGRQGLSRMLLPSERTQMPALRFALENLKYIKANEAGACPADNDEAVLFDDCRPQNANLAELAMRRIRGGEVPPAHEWPHMRGLSCLAAEWYALRPDRGGNATRDAFHYSHIHALINRIRGLVEDERFREIVDVEGGPAGSPEFSMAEEGRGLVTRLFGGQAEGDTTWSVHVIDLSRLTQDLMPFVLGSLLELYAAELFRRGPGNTHPTLLVLEEAHHYLRQLPGDSETGQHALAYERLAKEGRKFGIAMLVSTQRPAEVSATVLAQCGTWIVFRLTNESDQRAVSAAAEAAASNITRQIAGLARGEAIVFGAAASVAARILVARPDPEPRSADPRFEIEWRVGDTLAPIREGVPNSV